MEFTKVVRRCRDISKHRDNLLPREEMVIWDRYGGMAVRR